jgi:ribosome biogenesis GTPase
MPDKPLSLEALGWNPFFAESFQRIAGEAQEPARVAIEDKLHYSVLTETGELSAQLPGKLLHGARHRAELPKVGDWVAIERLTGEAKALIRAVLPRRTRLARKVPDRELEEQVLAANVDLVFVVQGLDRGVNARLLARQLVLARDGGASPVVVLNKVDLCADPAHAIAQATEIAGPVPVLAVSAKTGAATDQLKAFLKTGVTAVFLGASGVGKSSLINRLYGEEIQATVEVRERDFKGRHATTWRQLIPLPQGGLVIDTPGLRELPLWGGGDGLQETFADIEALAAGCRFRDCTHTVETHCAVRQAVADGQLAPARYESYVKLRRELAQWQAAQHPRAGPKRPRLSRPHRRPGSDSADASEPGG